MLLWAAIFLTPALAAERGSDAAVREIIQTGLDKALEEQVQHLFATLLRDDTGQPQRAAAGIRKAVARYRHAIKAIETQPLQ